MKYQWISLLFILASITAGAYYLLGPTSHKHDVPAVIRVGVLPDEADEILRERYTPLVEYLSHKTGLQTRLVIPQGYSELMHLFANHELDLVFFGGLTFVQTSRA